MKYVTPIFLYQDTFVGLNARVEDYVIRHPKCNRVDISKALEILPNNASSMLHKLAEQGRVRRVKSRGDSGEWVWEAGPGADYEPKEVYAYGNPVRKMVSEWEPCTLRDPMIDLLFGRQV